MVKIAFALILALACAEPLWAADDPCRGVKEIAALSARSKELMARLESFEASVNARERAYFDRFESEKTLTLSGTVTEFQWTNPRAGVMLTVNGTENWTIEMNPLPGLIRIGWRAKTLTPGMPIIVVIHQLRDGSNGGHLLSVTLPDGTQLGGGDRPGLLQELPERAASQEASTLEYLKKKQLLGCDIN